MSLDEGDTVIDVALCEKDDAPAGSVLAEPELPSEEDLAAVPPADATDEADSELPEDEPMS